MVKVLSGLMLAVMAPAGCSDDSAPLAPAPANASVYVLHGINGTDLQAAAELPVDVSVDGACTLTNFQFKSVAGPLALPPGTYAIAISLANATTPCSNQAVINASVPVTAGINATIVAHLANQGFPTAPVFVNEFSATSPEVFARVPVASCARRPACAGRCRPAARVPAKPRLHRTPWRRESW